jgi:hypothetical protein
MVNINTIITIVCHSWQIHCSIVPMALNIVYHSLPLRLIDHLLKLQLRKWKSSRRIRLLLNLNWLKIFQLDYLYLIQHLKTEILWLLKQIIFQLDFSYQIQRSKMVIKWPLKSLIRQF